MTQFIETFNGLNADSFLYIDDRFSVDDLVCRNADAWRIKCRLGMVVEGEHIQQDLHMSLWLYKAAYNTIQGVQRPV